MVYLWNTLSNGVVEVDRADGFERLTLDGPNVSTARVLELVADVLEPASRAYALPLPWLCAIAYAESGGRADARSPDGGWGLMQIQRSNFAWLKLDEATALDPHENVRAACELLRSMGAAQMELPAVASRYNAGGNPTTGTPWMSLKSPWGMRETPGYIERVVRANNWFVETLRGHAPPAPAPSSGIGLLFAVAAMAVVGWVVLR